MRTRPFKPALSAMQGGVDLSGSVLEPGRSEAVARAAALAATLLWSVGVVLYLVVATMVLVRLLLLELTPDDLSPPYWIAMGATAITVLAGARLLLEHL